MKRKTFRIPEYRGVLATPESAYSGDRLSFYLDALAEHYYQLPPFQNLDKAAEDVEARLVRLVICLAMEIVPAFRVPLKGGAPARVRMLKGDTFPFAHEARLVQLVTKFQSLLKAADRSAARTHAYNQIILLLKKRPTPHWAYGGLTKQSSFGQAWKHIPKNVKTTPAAFLPKPTTSREEAAAAGGLFGVANWLVATEAEKVWAALPAIPNRLVA